MDDALKFGAYVVLLLPGFIFVQTRDYHLLRENKGQFEKTLEIILWSAFLWVIACAVPIEWPFLHSRVAALNSAATAVFGGAPGVTAAITRASGRFLLTVCVWSFVAANFWGYLRKTRFVEVLVRWVTDRDWYPSVAFRFFKESVDRAVIIQVDDTRYLGILFAAPDNKEDKYVLLKSVAILPKPGEAGRLEPLPLVESLLIKVDDISTILSYSGDVLRDRPVELPRGWKQVAALWQRLLAVFHSIVERLQRKPR